MPDSPSLKRKVKEIETLLSNDPIPPVEALKKLALSEGGLVCGKLRCMVVVKNKQIQQPHEAMGNN